jgi:hypothetical protein
MIGRRVPKSWLKRTGEKLAGFLSFQENIWVIIKQSMSLAKRKATESGKLKFIMTTDKESEDMNYNLEWIKIIIQGTEAQEKEEYEEAMKMYSPLSKIFKKDMPKNDVMSKHLKSKLISPEKMEQAYKEGYGSMSDNNLANKLLEMGIITIIDWHKDYDTRVVN